MYIISVVDLNLLFVTNTSLHLFPCSDHRVLLLRSFLSDMIPYYVILGFVDMFVIL